MTRKILSIAIPDFGGAYPSLDVLPRQQQLLEALYRFGYESQKVGPKATAEQIWRRVSTFLANGKPSDTLIVHVVSHGEVLNDQLLVVDSRGESNARTSVDGWMLEAVERDEERSTKPPTLFIVDLCGAGAVARRQWDAHLDDAKRRVWVLAATEPDMPAYDARLTTAVAEVLNRTADRSLDLHESVAELPFRTFTKEVRAAVRRLSSQYPQNVLSTRIDPASATPEPPFFPNPAQLRSSDVLPFDPWYFLSRAASGRRVEQADLSGRANRFVGRKTQLARLSSWTDEQSNSRLCAVTGKAGVGKSAIVGFLACATHPELHYVRDLFESSYAVILPRQRTVMAAASVRDRELQPLLRSLAQQLGLMLMDTSAWDIPQFISELKRLESPEAPLIVLDALDEAGNVEELVGDLLIPLLELSRPDGQPLTRILVATRRVPAVSPLLSWAQRENNLVDLDETPSKALYDDLTGYVLNYLKVLPGSQDWPSGSRKVVAASLASALTAPIGTGQAASAGEFLIATLFVSALARMLPHEAKTEAGYPPSDVLDLFDFDMRRRGADGAALTAMLEVLAFARGYGMPQLMLIGGDLPGLPDGFDEAEVVRLLDIGSFYLTRHVDRDGTTLYRLFHRELATKLRTRVRDGDNPQERAERYERALVRKILSLVPPSLSGRGRHWNLVPMYLLRHSLEHAAVVDATESFMGDAWFVVRADPVAVATFLRASRTSRVLARPERPDTRADRMAEVYRISLGRHATLTPADRRDVLAIDARRMGFDDIADDLAAAVEQPGLRWSPGWVSNAEISRALMHVVSGTFEHGPLLAIARNGNERLVLVVEGSTVTMWRLDSGDGTPSSLTTGAHHRLRALTVADLVAGPTVIAGDEAGDLHLWPLRTGALRHIRVCGRPATALSTAVRDGRAVVLVGCEGNEIHIVDPELRSEATVLTGIRTRPTAIMPITGQHERDTLVAACGPPVSGISLWRLSDGSPAGILGGHLGGTNTLATVERLGRRWLISGGQDRTIKLWDPWLTGSQGTTLGLTTEIPALSAADRDGDPAIVVANDTAARVYDVAQWGSLAGVLPGHGQPVRAVTCLDSPGSCVLATGSTDQIRIWNLDRAQPSRHHTDRVSAIAIGAGPDGDIMVSGANDGGMRGWRWNDGAPQDFTGHPYKVSWLTAITGPSMISEIISCDVDGGVRKLSLATGRSQRLKAISKFRAGVFVRTEGTGGPTIVMACEDRTLRSWDPLSDDIVTIGRQIKPLLMAPVKGHADGAIILVSKGPQRRAQVSLLSAVFGEILGELTLPEFPTAVGGAIRQGKPVAAFGYFDGRCEIWNFDGVRSAVLRGKPRPINVIDWHPATNDPLRLLTGGEDATVRMWHVDSRSMEKVMCFPHAVRALAVREDGRLAAGFGWEVCALAP